MNFGVAGGTDAVEDSWPLSTKGTKEVFAGVFGGKGAVVFVFVAVLDVGMGGGGISSGPGSRYTAIFELEDADAEAEAIRLLFPACFSVVPTNFFTSGTFSFTLVFRVPRSCHASVEPSACCDSVPVGSTNI